MSNYKNLKISSNRSFGIVFFIFFLVIAIYPLLDGRELRYWSLIISFLFLIYAKEIINLITDIEFLRYLSYKYLLWVIIIPPIASFCYQLDGIFIGATQTKEMRNSMIISVVIYVILSTFLTQKLHNYGIWFSLLIFMILRASTLHLYFPKILKKFK